MRTDESASEFRVRDRRGRTEFFFASREHLSLISMASAKRVSRHKRAPVNAVENIVLAETAMIDAPTRHRGCCGHPCALEGDEADHVQNEMCCLCEACILVVLQVKIQQCLRRMRCGHLCTTNALRPLAHMHHRDWNHLTGDTIREALSRKSLHECTCTCNNSLGLCAELMMCGHRCHMPRMTHAHPRVDVRCASSVRITRPRDPEVCRHCLAKNLEFVLGRDARTQSRLCELPVGVVARVLEYVHQPMCMGCEAPSFTSQLRRLESPEDAACARAVIYCRPTVPMDWRLRWAPTVDGKCIWRFLPEWYSRVYEAQARLHNDDRVQVLVARLVWRIRAREERAAAHG